MTSDRDDVRLSQEIDEASPLPARAWPRFTILDLLFVMMGVGLGLAGGTWMPADVFAAVLGLVTLVGLLVVHLYPPESKLAALVWGMVVLAYITAVGAALVRPAVWGAGKAAESRPAVAALGSGVLRCRNAAAS